MIKNIILDIGGVMFDDSKANIVKILNKNCDEIYKSAYGKGFKSCLRGDMTVEEYINTLRGFEDFEDISYILKKDNLPISYPIMKDNFEYIMSLKEKGYKLYLLTNITEDSYCYINDLINFKENFDGGIYSYQENLIKPDHRIYELILDKFKLNKDETIFFDDKEKNVIAARKLGIKAVVFKSIDDIKNNV